MNESNDKKQYLSGVLSEMPVVLLRPHRGTSAFAGTFSVPFSASGKDGDHRNHRDLCGIILLRGLSVRQKDGKQEIPLGTLCGSVVFHSACPGLSDRGSRCFGLFRKSDHDIFYLCGERDVGWNAQLTFGIWCDIMSQMSLRRIIQEDFTMKHIKSLSTRNLKESMKKGGCGECQTSCQSACKTSCTVGNQSCESVKSK